MDILDFLEMLNKQRKNIKRVEAMGKNLKAVYNQLSEENKIALDASPLFDESGFSSVSEYMASIEVEDVA
jgi:SepF-like predicted cell division protein (DUF552 family)